MNKATQVELKIFKNADSAVRFFDNKSPQVAELAYQMMIGVALSARGAIRSTSETVNARIKCVKKC